MFIENDNGIDGAVIKNGNEPLSKMKTGKFEMYKKNTRKSQNENSRIGNSDNSTPPIIGNETLLSQADLARIFNRNASSIWRAIERGELPPPTRLFGKNMWTTGSIIRHIENRLKAVAEERELSTAEIDRRIAHLKP
jgi:hypothetical protein